MLACMRSVSSSEEEGEKGKDPEAGNRSSSSSSSRRGVTRYRLLWSVPSPLETYGATLVDQVYETDPEAVVWDTRMRGRPHIVMETWKAYQRFGAEAVIVISNPKVTALIKYAVESRGVPAYGPIFDI